MFHLYLVKFNEAVYCALITMLCENGSFNEIFLKIVVFNFFIHFVAHCYVSHIVLLRISLCPLEGKVLDPLKCIIIS